jgi:acetyl esterase/lipase
MNGKIIACKTRPWRAIRAPLAMMAAALWIAPATAQSLSAGDFLGRPAIEADYRIPYGEDELQFGDLRLPEGEGPHPVAVVVHGGCWSSIATLQCMDAFSVALTKVGFATWNLEYRRVDSPGGGWPSTFLDVALGIDAVRDLAEEFPLDLERVLVLGHSAGGHLALWAAGRQGLSKESELFVEEPLQLLAVVSLGGPGDLRGMRSADQEECGFDVVDALVGGTPEEVPDRYASASPVEMLPLGCPQLLVAGELDEAVPPAMVESFAARSREAGDTVRVLVLPKAGHFEMVAPWTEAWPTVEEAILAQLASAEPTAQETGAPAPKK